MVWLVALLVGCSVLTSCSEQKKRTRKAAVKVETLTVGGSNASGKTKDYVGTIEEKTGSTLSFELGGNITSIHVDEGDRVSKGQVLATINPTTLNETHRGALSTLKQAQDAYRRFQPLHKAGTISDIKWVVAIFMILFGVNFNAYYYIIYRHFKKAFKMEEVRCYFAIILIATAIIFANILDRCVSIFDALTKSVFQVASLITSTGFSSTDFNLWPQICRTVLVLIMFIGACAGSTGGGIKVSRVIVLFKTMIKELHSYIHPKSIRKVNLDGKPVEHEIVRSINVYIVTFVIIFASSVFMVAFDGKDLVTNFTAVLTTINNMGPGLAEVGPTGNFSNFSVFSKFVFMFDMLAGRLELFPLLILFHPSAWKDLISKRAEARKF